MVSKWSYTLWLVGNGSLHFIFWVESFLLGFFQELDPALYYHLRRDRIAIRFASEYFESIDVIRLAPYLEPQQLHACRGLRVIPLCTSLVLGRPQKRFGGNRTLSYLHSYLACSEFRDSDFSHCLVVVADLAQRESFGLAFCWAIQTGDKQLFRGAFTCIVGNQENQPSKTQRNMSGYLP